MGKCLRALKGLIFLANRTEEAKQMLESMESLIQFELYGEEPFYVEIKNGKMVLKDGKVGNASATITCESQTFYRIIMGEIDQEEAFVKKLYQISGSITDAVRFRRISQIVQERNKGKINFLLKFGRLFL
ncbi:MAG: SCP2 sterol-binding domain-containing protein [Nitrososphaerales archaeon]